MVSSLATTTYTQTTTEQSYSSTQQIWFVGQGFNFSLTVVSGSYNFVPLQDTHLLYEIQASPNFIGVLHYNPHTTTIEGYNQGFLFNDSAFLTVENPSLGSVTPSEIQTVNGAIFFYGVN